MDRSMYGKVIPGTLNPFECTLKHGIVAPGSCVNNKINNKIIPVFIVEYHHEILPYIYRNIGAKKLPLNNCGFIHFDSHPDMLVPKMLQADSVYDKEKLFEEISIENWLFPAVYAGFFDQLLWIKPPWAQQIADSSQSFKIGKDSLNGTIRVDCKENYFIYEGLFKSHTEMENVKEVELDVATLGHEIVHQDPPNPENLTKLLQKFSNKSYILDIDLDFFSTSNPFLNLYSKSKMYEFVKEIFKISPPKSKEIADIEEFTQMREAQLKRLEDLFKFIQENKKMPQHQDEISGKVAKLRDAILENYSESEIDWELIFDAGSTCDDSDLPHHVSSDADLAIMYDSFRKFLQILSSLIHAPEIITISRSTVDDYTPSEDVEEIQEMVLKMLQETFKNCSIIYDYLNNN